MKSGAIDIPRAGSPYPERGDQKLSALDLALTQLLARISSRFERHAARFAAGLPLVDACARTLVTASDAELARYARELRSPLLRHGFRQDLTARSLAIVGETAARKLRLRPYPVQHLGAFALLNGMFAEMETGEGKTLTGLLAAATAALAGTPVHVITVNDYLAARDATELKPVYEALGLTVGVVQHGQDPTTRRAAYACDVTYAVNKEIAFDYLRDGLSLGSRRSASRRLQSQLHGREATPLLLRGLHFAIVDEADSVLIDEARTPLIISGADDEEPGDASLYPSALQFARQLEPGTDFVISSSQRHAELTPDGASKLRRLADGLGGLWNARKAREELVSLALNALHLYKIDQHYVVTDGKVQIIDEFTGRVAEGRSWQHGLHQLIETKESCDTTGRQQTRASITYQRFFRRYLHLAGMSGTLSEVAPELQAVYGRPVVRIPTNRPSCRSSHGIRIFQTAQQKWKAVVEAVNRHQQAGRPVLVGTRSIAVSELLSRLLTAERVEHVVLNARHDREEAAIVAKAGERGRVTVATNMAGRGTDIKLGPAIASLGGLHVILTELHEAARIDRQLIGRGGRQGDPGSFEVIAALDDELMAVHGRALRGLIDHALPRGRALLPTALAHTVRRYAQSHAQRLHRRIRRQTLRLQEDHDRALAFARPE